MSASNPQVISTFEQLVRTPSLQVYDILAVGSVSMWVGSNGLHLETEVYQTKEQQEEAMRTFLEQTILSRGDIARLGQNVLQGRTAQLKNNCIDLESGSSRNVPQDHRLFYLCLLARAEAKGMKYDSLKPGQVVFPTYLNPDSRLPKNLAEVGVVLDRRDNDVLVLWNDGEACSCNWQDVMRVNYTFYHQEWEDLWGRFKYNDNWNKVNSTPRLKEKARIKEYPATPAEATKRGCTQYRYYWQLQGRVLKNGDTIVLFDRYILTVRLNRFQDTTSTDEKAMWWAKPVAGYLGLDFDTMFFPTAERLGFYYWKEAPADKLRYQWQYTTYNNATAWALWMLAISDLSRLKPAYLLDVYALWEHTKYAIPNGLTDFMGGGSHAMMPSKLASRTADNKTVALNHPVSGLWYGKVHGLIPVFRDAETYNQTLTFFTNKTTTHVVQDQSPGTDPGRQTAEARRKPLQKAQTQDGGGYSSNRRRSGRGQGKAGSSTLSGHSHPAEHRRVRGKYAHGDPGSEGRSSELRAGPQGPQGGICNIVSEREWRTPGWAISSEVSECPQCMEASFYAERTTPCANETITHYRCANADCEHTDSFP